MMRLSLNPAKQLLWLWLFWDMRLSKGKKTGIDAGCGFMHNRPMFRTKEYIGIDIDRARLASGQERYPAAKAVQSRIEEVQGLTGDFVLCVQVLHNKYFDPECTVAAVRNLTDCVQDGGMLILNIGKRNMIYESELDGILTSAFRSVTKRIYGSFASKPILVGPILALAMLLVPPLRSIGGPKKIYYKCEGRLGA